MTTDYAIINTGGKQYRVRAGDTVDVEYLDGEVGSDITFDRVLLTSVDGKLSVGAPAVEGASVDGEIADQSKGDKVISLRYKNKTRPASRHPAQPGLCRLSSSCCPPRKSNISMPIAAQAIYYARQTTQMAVSLPR